jgi:hypothetical protein
VATTAQISDYISGRGAGFDAKTGFPTGNSLPGSLHSDICAGFAKKLVEVMLFILMVQALKRHDTIYIDWKHFEYFSELRWNQ